jgi:chromosome segregation ATPase
MELQAQSKVLQNKAAEEILTRDETIKNSQVQIISGQADRESLNAKLNQARVDQAAQEKQLLDLRKEAEQIQFQLTQKSEAVTLLEKSNMAIGARAKALESSFRQAQNGLAQTQAALRSAEELNKALNARITSAALLQTQKESQITALNLSQKELQSQILQLTEQSKQIQASSQEIRSEKKAIETELAAARDRETKLQVDVDQKSKELIQQGRVLEELTARKSALETTLKSAQTENISTKSQLQEIQQKLDLISKETSAVSQAKISLEQALEGSQGEIRTLQTKLEASEVSAKAAQNNLQNANDRIQKLMNISNSAQQELAQHESALRDVSAARDQLAAERDLLAAQNQSQQGLLDRAEAAWKNKFAQAEALWNSRIQDLSARLSKVGSGIEAAREESRRYQEELRESRVHEVEAQTDRIKLNTELAKSSAQIKREQQEREAVAMELASSQKAYTSVQAELTRLNADMARASNELSQSRSGLTTLQQENQSLKKSQVAAQSQVTQVQQELAGAQAKLNHQAASLQEAQTKLQELTRAKEDLQKSLLTSQAQEAASAEQVQNTQATLSLQLAKSQEALRLLEEENKSITAAGKTAQARTAQELIDLKSQLTTALQSQSQHQAETQKLQAALEENRKSIAGFEAVRKSLSDRLTAAEESTRTTVSPIELEKNREELKMLQKKLNDSITTEKALRMEVAMANRNIEQAGGAAAQKLNRIQAENTELRKTASQLQAKVSASPTPADLLQIRQALTASEAEKVRLRAQVEELKKAYTQTAVAYKKQSIEQLGLRKKLEVTAKNTAIEAQPVAASSAVETSQSLSPLGRLSAIRALKIMRTDPELMKKNQAPLKQRATATLIIFRPENDYLLVSMDHIMGLKEGVKIRLKLDHKPIYDTEIRTAGDYDMMTLRITKRHLDAATFSKGQIFEAEEITG